jgi:hypothetical protein
MASQSQAVQNLSPETKAQAVEAARPAAELMERATAHRPENQTTTHDTSSDRGGKDAMMHTQGAPGKTQEALSPTDSHKGQTPSQQRSPNRGRGMER